MTPEEEERELRTFKKLTVCKLEVESLKKQLDESALKKEIYSRDFRIGELLSQVDELNDKIIKYNKELIQVKQKLDRLKQKPVQLPLTRQEIIDNKLDEYKRNNTHLQRKNNEYKKQNRKLSEEIVQLKLHQNNKAS